MAKRIRFLFMLASLLTYAFFNGIEVFIFWFNRTAEQQKELFEKGLSYCDGYKITSKHQFWEAVDICVWKDGKDIWDHIPEYDKLGSFWELLGGRWGGRWKDPKDIYHFEI